MMSNYKSDKITTMELEYTEKIKKHLLQNWWRVQLHIALKFGQ